MTSQLLNPDTPNKKLPRNATNQRHSKRKWINGWTEGKREGWVNFNFEVTVSMRVTHKAGQCGVRLSFGSKQHEKGLKRHRFRRDYFQSNSLYKIPLKSDTWRDDTVWRREGEKADVLACVNVWVYIFDQYIIMEKWLVYSSILSSSLYCPALCQWKVQWPVKKWWQQPFPAIFLCVCAVFGLLHLIYFVLWNQSVEFDWFNLQTQTTEEKGGTAATQKCSIMEYYIFTSDENKRCRHRLHVCDTYHHFDEYSLLVYVQSIHQDF